MNLKETTLNYEDYKKAIEGWVTYWIVCTSQHLFNDFDDFLGEANYEFVKCQKKLKPNTEDPSSFLRRCIFNHLNRYLSREITYQNIKREIIANPGRYGDSVSFPVDCDTARDKEGVIVTSYRTPEEEEVYKESLRDIVDKVKELTEEDKELLSNYCNSQGSYSKMASDEGVSRQAIHQRMERVLGKIRDSLGL